MPQAVGKVSTNRQKSRKWLSRIKITALLLFTAAVLYFFFTGSWFITRIAMPLLSDVIGYGITAQEARLSLWNGELELRNFNFGPGWQPIVSADSCVIKFNPATLMRGEINISTVKIDGADIAIVRNIADNFNVLPAKFKRKRKGKEIARAPWRGEMNIVMPPVSIGQITFNDTTFLLDYILNGENIVMVKAGNISGAIGQLVNGGESTLHLSGECEIHTGKLELEHSFTDIDIRFGVTDAFIPRFAEAAITMNQLSGHAARLDLTGKTLSVTGYAEGDNIFKHLDVDHIKVDITDRDQPFANAEISAQLDFFPWKMHSEYTLSKLPREAVGCILDFFNLSWRSAEITGTGSVDFIDDKGIFSSSLALHDQAGPYDVDLEGSGKLICSFRQQYLELAGLTAKLNLNDLPSADINISSPIRVLWGPEPRLVGKPGDIELKLNNLELSVFERYIDLPDIELSGGRLSMDILCSPDPELAGMQLSGWGMVEDINLTTVNQYNYNHLSGSISLNAEVNRKGVMKFNDFELVFADENRNLMAAQLSNTIIDASSGECRVELAVSGVKESVMQIQPLYDWLKSSPEAEKIIEELKPLELTGQLKMHYKPGSESISFDNAGIAIYSCSKKIAEITVNPNTYNISSGIMKRDFDLDIVLHQLEFHPVWYNLTEAFQLPFDLTGGIVNGKLHLAAPHDLSTIALSGNLMVDNCSLKIVDASIQPLQFNPRFKLEIDRLGRNTTISAAVKARQHHEKVLDFTVDMTIPMDSNTPRTGTVVLNQLSTIWGDMLGLENLASLNGTGMVNFSWQGINNFNTDIQFNFDSVWDNKNDSPRTIAGQAAAKLHGTRDGVFLNRGIIQFASPEEQLCDAGFSGSWNSRDNIINLNLDSRKIAAKTIFNIIKFKRQKMQPDNPVLYFGKIPIILDASLNDISWGEGINASSRVKLRAQGNSLLIERMYLIFNGAEIRAVGEFNTAADNQSYALSILADDVELATLLAPVLSSSYSKLYAAITHFSLDIQGKSFSRTGFWDTQEGVLSADFGRVILPNAIGSNPFGRILLLPFSIIANLHDWLPVNFERMQRMTQIITLFRNFYSHTGAFEFNHGNLVLRSKGGRIAIESFHLSGAPIKNFTFSGSFGLGSKRELDLHSTVEVMSILIPIDITGTVDNPETDYPKIIANILMDNFLNLMDFINPLNLLPEDDNAA